METGTRSNIPLRERDPLTRLLRTRPLLLAAALFLLGCILQFAVSFSCAALSIALAFAFMAALLLRRRGAIAAAVLVLALLPLGALRFEFAWRAVEPMPDQSDALLCGRISEEPDFNAATQRTICVLSELTVDGAPERGRLRLYLRGDEAMLQGVRLGQRVEVIAHIRPADAATNPGQFDNANFFRAHGLRNYATAEIESAALSDPESRLTDLPERMRVALGARIDRLFSENADIARALILGDRSRLSSEARANYNRAGAAHLLAISGMHISILAGALALLLRCYFNRSKAFGLTLVLLIAYGVLTGFTPSVFRAIVMFAFLGMAPMAGRRSDALTRLGASMLLYLFIRPLAILDAGFVLSYGATAGILLLSPPLSRLPVLRLASQRDAEFLKPLRRLLRWIVGMLTMTIAAQLSILPAVAHYFGAQPVWSLVTNLIAAPLTMLGYILALIAVLFNFAPLAASADFLFSLLTRLVVGIASLPLAELRIARFPLWLTLICALICIAASDLSRLPVQLRNPLPFVLLLAIPLANLCAWITTLGVSVVFLDVGQADCAVIRSEGRVYLVDVGDSYTPAADYLSAMNYRPEAVLLTHPHVDHAGGLADILEVYVPKRVYVSANWDSFEEDPALNAALESARAGGAEIIAVSAGDEIALSEHVVLRVLAPKEGFSTNSANDDSLILRLEYGDARALFLADASAEITEGLAGDIDLLKVAHHGARDGTNAALLAETTPSAAMISVGRNNSYGHPVPRVLQLLEASGARIFRTDRSGAVTCRIHEDGTLQLRGYRTSEDG